MHLVTVAMPVYNAEAYVESALLSALNQTFETIEYIIVDDKGCDSSMDIVKKIINIHPRGKFVRIIEHPHNLGTGATKNTIMDNARGDFLFFMDSDDEISPDCIRILYEEMMKNDLDVVCGSHSEIFLDGTSTFISEEYMIRDDKEQIIFNYYNGKYPVVTWNKLYKTSILKENNIRCISHQTLEDNFFSFQLLLSINSYSMIPDITYYYKRRENSQTQGGGEWSESVYKQWEETFDCQLYYLKQKELPYTFNLKVKEKIFWHRFHVAKKCSNNKNIPTKYINHYLRNLASLKDCMHSKSLFFGYWLSFMPLIVKKKMIKAHTKLSYQRA